MDIFEEDHDRVGVGDVAQVAHQMSAGHGGEVGTAKQVAHRLALGEVEPNPVADEVSLVGRQVGDRRLLTFIRYRADVPGAQKAGPELLDGHRPCVAVANVEAKGEQVAEQAVGHRLQINGGTAFVVGDGSRQ